ncbi:hypothetical protein [Streptomyces sp. NPDC088246]|uniref:hypothetical protein n=1 Tax=Streptomyces sp. NPDC088246 TaxID=3365842 RepID=UPI00381C96AF
MPARTVKELGDRYGTQVAGVAGDVMDAGHRAEPAAAAAVNGRVRGARVVVVVHFSTGGEDERWAWNRVGRTARATVPRPGGPAGTVAPLPSGSRLVLEEPLDGAGQGARLWWAQVPVDVPGLGCGGRRCRWMCRGCCGGRGRPVRYAYPERDQPLSAYRTVFALPSADGSGSTEMPSAARPFTARCPADTAHRVGGSARRRWTACRPGRTRA